MERHLTPAVNERPCFNAKGPPQRKMLWNKVMPWKAPPDNRFPFSHLHISRVFRTMKNDDLTTYIFGKSAIRIPNSTMSKPLIIQLYSTLFSLANDTQTGLERPPPTCVLNSRYSQASFIRIS